MENNSYNTVSSLGVDIRLVKYALNSSNKISKIYFATAAKDGYTKDSSYSVSDKTYDRRALVMGTTNMTDQISVGNMLSNYYLNDGMLEFTVPNTNAEMLDSGNYSIATAKASSYLNKENAIGKDCIFGEFSDSKQTYPTVVIHYVGSVNAAAAVTDYGTADNNPCFMVDKISSGVDDDDNEIFTITGYSNGSEVKYTTKKNTLLAKQTGLFSSSTNSNNRNYDATLLWDAVNGVTEDGASLYAGARTLTDFISKGDVVGVAGSGSVLMLMVDASELADAVLSGTDLSTVNNGLYNAQNPGVSTSRDNIYIGKVSDSQLDDNAMMSVAGYKNVFDTSRGMDTLLISESGKLTLSAENNSTIADVMDFDDDTRVGDFAFVRYANKGTIQEIFLFRFED
jgi:hypothetical protein